jgi:DNA-directed RNA polymerase alpha subunit
MLDVESYRKGFEDGHSRGFAEGLAAAHAQTCAELASPTPGQAQFGDTLETLDLRQQIYNRLRRAGISTVDELLKTTDAELRAIPGIARNSVAEIQSALAAAGYQIKHDE